MKLKINKLLVAGSVLIPGLPAVRAGSQNWFTSTGKVEDGKEPLPGAIEQVQENTIVQSVNPRMFDLTISLHNAPAGTTTETPKTQTLDLWIKTRSRRSSNTWPMEFMKQQKAHTRSVK